MVRALLLFSLACIAGWAADKTTAPPAKKADRIVVEKSARTMKLMLGSEVLKTYKVALSREPVGAKEREGDHRVPEGEYVIDSKNSHSRFHLALHISYPNAGCPTFAFDFSGALPSVCEGGAFLWVAGMNYVAIPQDRCG